MRKKGILPLVFIFLSVFLFIQPIKADPWYEGADNVYDPEPDYSYLDYGNGYGIIYLSGGQELFWEFSTILEEYNATLTIYNNSIGKYPIILSTNETCNSGTYMPTDSGSHGYKITWSGVGGYFYINMWKYDRPEAHPEPTWEWNIRNEFVGGYYAKYISFEADEYDYFLVAWKSSNSVFGYGCSIYGCSGDAGFVDQAGFDHFIEAMNPSVSGDIFKGLTQAFRPTHNDTWYFIWVNSDDDDAYYNITVRCTENYYGFPPEPEPEPEPIPKPEPEPNDVIIPFIIGFGVLGLIGVVGIGLKMTHKREIKKEEQAEQIRLKPKYLEQQGVEAEKLRQQHLEKQKLEREKGAIINKQQPKNAMIYGEIKNDKKSFWSEVYCPMKQRELDRAMKDFKRDIKPFGRNNKRLKEFSDLNWDYQLDLYTYVYIGYSMFETGSGNITIKVTKDDETGEVTKYDIGDTKRGWDRIKERAYEGYLQTHKNLGSKESVLKGILEELKKRTPMILVMLNEKPESHNIPTKILAQLEKDRLETERIKRQNENQSTNLMIKKGTKDEIWKTYIRMKRNNDKRLHEFLSYDNNRNVIAKKDFDVFQTKSSNMYHRRSCGYLSRSRTLKRMSRSDAIISGGVKCNSCMKEFNSSACIIGFIIVVVITIIGILTGGIYF